MIKNSKITGKVQSNRLVGRVLTKLLGLDFVWDGTRLGVKREKDTEYEYADLEGPQGPIGPEGHMSQEDFDAMHDYVDERGVIIGSSQPSTEKVWLKKGKNLIDATKIMYGTVEHGQGNYKHLTYAAVTDFIPVQAGSYHLHLFNPGSGNNRILVFRIVGYDGNKNYLWDDSDLDTTDRTITGTSTKYLRICFAINGYQVISSLNTIKNSQPQLEVGTSASTYEAYIPKEILIKNDNGTYEKFVNANDIDTKLEKTINVTIANQNLNDYTTEGRYYFDAGNPTTNIPAGVNGILEVLTAPSGMVKQVWYRHGTPNTNDYETYVRTFSSDTWSSWKRYAMVGADDIICRSATATFAETTTTGNSSVPITASIPSGYKFLCWIGVASTGWVSEGLYIDNYSGANANVWTGNSVRNPKTVTGYYLCIKNA